MLKTLMLAGAVALGGLALAPAASAAPVTNQADVEALAPANVEQAQYYYRRRYWRPRYYGYRTYYRPRYRYRYYGY